MKGALECYSWKNSEEQILISLSYLQAAWPLYELDEIKYSLKLLLDATSNYCRDPNSGGFYDNIEH